MITHSKTVNNSAVYPIKAAKNIEKKKVATKDKKVLSFGSKKPALNKSNKAKLVILLLLIKALLIASIIKRVEKTPHSKNEIQTVTKKKPKIHKQLDSHKSLNDFAKELKSFKRTK